MRIDEIVTQMPDRLKERYMGNAVFASIVRRNCSYGLKYEQIIENAMDDLVEYMERVTESHINNVMNSSCSSMLIDNKKLENLDER